MLIFYHHLLSLTIFIEIFRFDFLFRFTEYKSQNDYEDSQFNRAFCPASPSMHHWLSESTAIAKRETE